MKNKKKNSRHSPPLPTTEHAYIHSRDEGFFHARRLIESNRANAYQVREQLQAVCDFWTRKVLQGGANSEIDLKSDVEVYQYCYLLSCLFLLFFSFLSFPFSFFAFFYFLSTFFLSFLCFFFPIELRLSCVYVVTGTSCNIYVVVFLGWQAVQSVFPGASSETYAPVWTWHIVG